MDAYLKLVSWTIPELSRLGPLGCDALGRCAQEWRVRCRLLSRQRQACTGEAAGFNIDRRMLLRDAGRAADSRGMPLAQASLSVACAAALTYRTTTSTATAALRKPDAQHDERDPRVHQNDYATPNRARGAARRSIAKPDARSLLEVIPSSPKFERVGVPSRQAHR